MPIIEELVSLLNTKDYLCNLSRHVRDFYRLCEVAMIFMPFN